MGEAGSGNEAKFVELNFGQARRLEGFFGDILGIHGRVFVFAFVRDVAGEDSIEKSSDKRKENSSNTRTYSSVSDFINR